MKRLLAVLIAFSAWISVPLLAEEHSKATDAARYFIKINPLQNSANSIVYPPLETEGDNLFAEVNGQNYLIYDPEFEFALKDIKQVLDLDGDGNLEAIVALHPGGMGVGKTYSIISHRGGGLFTVHMHRDLYSWADIKILEDKSLVINQKSIGAENVSMEENQYVFRFTKGQLELVSQKLFNTLLPAELEIQASDLRDEPSQSIILETHLDQDQSKDNIFCAYWRRWGSMRCEIWTSQNGTVKLPSCKRIGVLASNTRGFKDLVCDRDKVLKFNGYSYE
jgi:hypothetical protein